MSSFRLFSFLSVFTGIFGSGLAGLGYNALRQKRPIRMWKQQQPSQRGVVARENLGGDANGSDEAIVEGGHRKECVGQDSHQGRPAEGVQ